MKRLLPLAAATIVGITVGYYFGHTRPVAKDQREVLEKWRMLQDALGYSEAEMFEAAETFPKPQEFMASLEREDEMAAIVALAGFRRLEGGDVDGTKKFLANSVGSYHRVYRDSPIRNTNLLSKIEEAADKYPLIAEEIAKNAGE